MRTALVVSTVLALSWFAHAGWAAPDQQLPSSSLHIPFDDYDETVVQSEISQQVLTFLRTVQSHWGESEAALRNAVAGDVERDENGQPVFARALAEHAVLEGYEFRNGLLVRGRYLVLQRPINRFNEFIDYYGAVKQALTTAYGRPSVDRTVWENDLYQPVPDYWGVAVMIGYLRYAATWETTDGTIAIELNGNRHCRLSVEYRIRRGGKVT